jgi:hypothetical protein
MGILNVLLDILDAADGIFIDSKERKKRKIRQQIRDENEHDNSWIFNGPSSAPMGFEDSHENRRKEAMAHQLELDLIMFIYVMNSDDGVVSSDEFDILKNHIDGYLKEVDPKRVKTIQKRLKETISLQDISNFIQDFQLSKTDISESLNHIKRINHSYRYSNAIFQIENHIQATMDY